ncbi:archease [Sulfurovum sp. XTW-4]|uniref:Archease n=1 Tax=Sulfurovum xiamenensis TaxID=3019066 RepID=A0ABT7QQ69_9BACT|nr:archease [Sulfurovum xiamenensis]MDM5263203.1 archease [Sulfurovum xiamenensis]
MNKKYSYFDHDADIGILGRGKSLEEAFESAAVAMFAIMADIDLLQCDEWIEIGFEEEDNEFALIEWLNTLLALAHMKHLVLGKFELHREGNSWRGKAWGDTWRKDLERGTEVKGATLTMLSVEEKEDHWEARCVVDV